MERIPLYSEGTGHFLKRKAKSLILGISLLLAGIILLPFMFLDLLDWSSLFPQETTLILIFLLVAPFVGVYFLLRTLIMGRFRIYKDGISNPTILGKRRIPASSVDHVSILIGGDLPWEVKVHLKERSLLLRIDSISIGKFTEEDTDRMRDALRGSGIKLSFI